MYTIFTCYKFDLDVDSDILEVKKIWNELSDIDNLLILKTKIKYINLNELKFKFWSSVETT